MNDKTDTATLAQQSGTGPGAETSTAQSPRDRAQYHLQSAEYFESAAALAKARANSHRKFAALNALEPGITDEVREARTADCLVAVAQAEQSAMEFIRCAEDARTLAISLCPETVPPKYRESRAVVRIEIGTDRICERVEYQLGPHHSLAIRNWTPTGGFWQTKDNDWTAHEDHLPVEIIDYMAGLDLPNRIAAMLPKIPVGVSKAAQEAAKAVRGE